MKRSTKIRTMAGFILAGLTFVIAAWIALAVGRVDFSACLMLMVSAFCLLYAGTADRNGRMARIYRMAVELCAGVAIISFTAVTISLNAYARENAVGTQSADYAVVFGAGVQGETPSLILTLRTRAAYEYLLAHPETRAVLSGGQGEGETITEAEAMRRLMTRWGMEEERLLIEDRATDTIENGSYSMALIGEGSVVAVSNAFHLRRCVQALENAGAVNVKTLSAPLPSSGVAISMYLREFCAVVYHAVFG